MSLDNIQLTKESCKNLFSSNLVEISGTLDQKEVKTEYSISSLGENNQRFFAVNNTAEAEAFGITLEPAGGSITPTLEQLYALGKV